MLHPNQHLGKLIVPIVLGTLCGCTEEPNLKFEKLFSTEHFDYYVEQGASPPCDGTDEWLERYYKANAKFFGAELPAGKKIQYHLVKSSRSLPLVGCSEGSGCTKGTTIHSTEAVHVHEIVHANASLRGNPPILFEEGVARLLSCTTTFDINEAPDMSAPIEDLIESSTFVDWQRTKGNGAYNAAAGFVRYLIDTFGAAKFLSFYAHTSWMAERTEIEATFEAELGIRLDDALSNWRQINPGLPGDNCLRVMECDASIPLLTNNDVALRCGPTGGYVSDYEAVLRFEIGKERVIEISTTPWVSEPQAPSSVIFYRCPSGNVIPIHESTAVFRLDKNLNYSISPGKATRRFVLDEPPGTYVAWFASVGKAQVHFEVTESLSPMRNGCASADAPLVLKDKQQTILTTRWIERQCNGFWCPGHSWDVTVGAVGAIEVQAAIVNDEAPFTPNKVYLCSEPCPADANQCETLTLDVSTGTSVTSKQTFGPGTVVYVGAPLAHLKEHFSLRMRLVPPCNGRVPCPDPHHGPR